MISLLFVMTGSAERASAGKNLFKMADFISQLNWQKKILVFFLCHKTFLWRYPSLLLFPLAISIPHSPPSSSPSPQIGKLFGVCGCTYAIMSGTLGKEKPEYLSSLEPSLPEYPSGVFT